MKYGTKKYNGRATKLVNHMVPWYQLNLDQTGMCHQHLKFTTLLFVFLNFSFVCQNNLRWSKTRQITGYCYNGLLLTLNRLGQKADACFTSAESLPDALYLVIHYSLSTESFLVFLLFSIVIRTIAYCSSIVIG